MSWLVRILGFYLLIRGGLTLLGGSFAVVIGAIAGPLTFAAGIITVLLAMGLLLAGGGLIAEQSWSRRVAVPVLLLDGVVRGLAGVLGPAPFDLIMALISLAAAAYLLLVNPLNTTTRPDIDEDTSVHDIGQV